MDEAAWNHCQLLYELLSVARERMNDRQRRLFAVACCSRSAGRMHDPRSVQALEVATRHADGRASDTELKIAQEAAAEVHIELRDRRLMVDCGLFWSREAELLAQAAALAAAEGIYYAEDAADCVRWALLASKGWRSEQQEEEAQCRLLREIVGPAGGAPAIQPAWTAANDRAALLLAEHIDREQAFDVLPILADALEDAGCDDERILRHCREEGEHVRGCWVLDRLLGRPAGR
jgi:hypothetical protein